jgi:uncharacterized protein
MISIRNALSTLIVCAAYAAISASAGAAETPSTSPQGEAPASSYVEPKFTHEPFGDVRIVVPLTSDDKGIQGMKIRNITNGLKAADAWKGKFTIKMVLYAKGVTLLKNPDDATKERLDALRSRGVQIEVCNNTLAEQGIDFHTLYHVTEADIVPSGFAEVAYLQAKKHFVVDPVN